MRFSVRTLWSINSQIYPSFSTSYRGWRTHTSIATKVCRMIHISPVTRRTLIKSSLSLFDDSFHRRFTECLALLNLSPQSSGWKQACLSLSRGGLGLRSVAVHSIAACIGSISSSSPDTLSIPLLIKSHL